MQKPKVFKCNAMRALLLLMMLFSGSFAFAQVIVPITGSVKDITGEVIIGATIVIKGSINGTSTDVAGKFKLNVPNPDKAILLVSYIGYEPYEVSLKSRTHVDAVLNPSTLMMDEVTIVAYGVQKKETLTGAISSVGTSDLLKSSNSSIANSLAGKITGLSSVQTSGQPGAEDPSIFIRGGGSLTDAASAPLILVDGIERSFFQMDPNEIQSVTVLKDASATAVFGVRGANGVILVTTRRGKEGKTTISISSSFSFQTPTRVLDMADSYTYATMHNELSRNDGKTTLAFDKYSIERFRLGDEPIMYPDMKWRDYMTNSFAKQTQHNLNISGGSKKVRYFISMGYLFQDGLLKDFGMEDSKYKYNRYNYRTNLDIDITSSTLLKLGIGGVVGDKHEPYDSSNLWMRINRSQPFTSPGVIDGRPIVSQNRYADVKSENPISLYYGAGYRSNISNTMNLDLTLTQQLDFVTKGLSIEVKGAYNTRYEYRRLRQGNTERYTPYYQSEFEGSSLPYDDPNYNKNIVYSIDGANTRLNYNEETRRGRDWYIETSLRYNRSFGDHSVSGLLLYNQDKKYYPKELPWIATAYIGLVGRLTYNYKTRYMAEFNIGYNGSENFAPDKRFGTFPSVSVGYILTEEHFMKNQNVFDYLKIRTSVGLVGNDKMGDYRFLYSPNSYNVDQLYDDWGSTGDWRNQWWGYNFSSYSDAVMSGTAEGRIGNPNVTWETVLKQNYGVDMQFLHSRLKVSFDYFIENRTDILIKRETIPQLSALTGVLPVVNMGEVDNKGFEADISWADNAGKDFSYWINTNVSHSKSEIIFKDEIEPNEPYLWRTGQPVGAIFGYIADGLYADSDFADVTGGALNDDMAKPNVPVFPGDVKYRDLNEDGKINDDDQMNIGHSTRPGYVFGLNFGANYKGFYFSMNWTGAANRSLVLSNDFREAFAGEHRGLMQFHVDNRWTPETASTATQPRLSLNSATHNSLQSTMWIVDGSYLKLKNLVVGYSFTGRKALKKIGIGQLDIKFTGYNLLTFDHFKIMDPESNPSRDKDTYPIVSNYSIGVNITF